jgi:hypothetical protein
MQCLLVLRCMLYVQFLYRGFYGTCYMCSFYIEDFTVHGKCAVSISKILWYMVNVQFLYRGFTVHGKCAVSISGILWYMVQFLYRRFYGPW